MTNDTGPAITPEKIAEWRALLAKATPIEANERMIGVVYWRGQVQPLLNALPDLLDLADRARSAQAETGWRSMESAPRDGTEIIAFDDVARWTITVFWTGVKTYPWRMTGGNREFSEAALVAWMPLPPPPAKGGSDA